MEEDAESHRSPDKVGKFSTLVDIHHAICISKSEIISILTYVVMVFTT